jgi:type I restriction enzyme S subunit
MSSSSERPTNEQTRTYDRASSVVFLKTDAPFGGLSNMAGGFPLHVQGTRIYTSEALYQACRFPHLPEVQQLIIGQASPMTAKMKSKPHRKDSRPDWDRVRVKVMRWCLRVKLAQNWAKFSELLLRTDDLPIVEESRRDDFWGAKPVDHQTLVGTNVLGRLLMELREAVRSQGRDAFRTVEPPDIPEFLLFGGPIGAIGGSVLPTQDASAAPAASPAERRPIQEQAEQVSLFDAPSVREAPAPGYAAVPGFERALLAGVRPYAAMKDSGVAWLGVVPEHWQILPNRAVFTEVKERDHPDAAMLSVTITKGVIRQRALLKDSSKKDSSNLDKSAYKLVRPGDIAYNKMRAWQGAVGVSEYEGIVSPAYVVQRAREGAAPHYLHYLLRTPAFAKEAERWSYGITSDMWSLRPEHFKLIYSCLPPVPEQVAIFRFLDHADRRIRRYIRAKQKLIKLLEEQKQAIIHRAVIRGLDPNVRLKPSGVEWLGNVPEHWDVCRLKDAAYVQTGLTLGKNYAGMVTESYPYLRVANVQAGHLNLTKVKRIDVPTREAMGATLRAGDVLMTEGGDIDKLGRGCVWRQEVPSCLHQNHVFAVRCRPRKLLPEFLVGLMASQHGRAYFQLTAKQTTNLASTNSTTLRAFPIMLPAIHEQQAILDEIKRQTSDVSKAVADARLEIDLLREYRTRLIADVVTGKLDVREAAAQLPDEVEEREPLDETETEGDADEAGADDTDEVPEEAEA